MKIKSKSTTLGIECFGMLRTDNNLEDEIQNFVLYSLDNCDARDTEFNLYVIDDYCDVVSFIGTRHTVIIKSSVVVKIGSANKNVDDEEYSVYEADGNIGETTNTRAFGKNHAHNEARLMSTKSPYVVIVESKNHRTMFRFGWKI